MFIAQTKFLYDGLFYCNLQVKILSLLEYKNIQYKHINHEIS